MELDIVNVKAEDYIETSSGNIISRASQLFGSQHIVLKGRTILRQGTCIRGDLGHVYVDRHCVISEGVVLRPPLKAFSKGTAFLPMKIGEYVYIGENSIVSSAQIGSCVHIGKNCVLSRCSILRDCCYIANDSVVSPDTVVPPFAIMKGNPGNVVICFS
ncbi:dynactin subunit 5 [Trichuris trichiura]|uniref:Dynactin subunit 5 n=1 Tax=Trichuris trichiura TaxID=36087 RepID=A0A077ZE74_TRITR|nr:dynactin subunit 5 [Trichuris trichiura]